MTFNQINEILKTLPIGYYLGHKLNVKLSDSEETSHYLPISNEIIISTNNFDTNCEEKNIRSVLYHEVAHALLTNCNQLQHALNCYAIKIEYNNLKVKYSSIMPLFDILNIFEDTRIETLTQNLFHNIDFYNNRFVCNNTTIEKVKNEYPTMDLNQKFYSIVRFNIGPEKFLKKVFEIVQEYKILSSTYNDYNKYVNYIIDILALFEKIIDDETKPQEQNQEQPQEQPQEQNQDIPVGSFQEMSKNMNQEELEQLFGNLDMNQEQIDDIINECYNVKLSNKIKQLFDNAIKKKGMIGSGQKGYSGHFNPRNIAKHESLERYNWWDKMVGEQCGRGQKITLNLWIDCSGSMSRSMAKVNELLNSIYKCQSNSFNYNVIEIIDNCYEGKLNINKNMNKKLVAYGGTNIAENCFEVYKQINKSDEKCINLVMFDGSTKNAERSKVWNHPNCVVISDPSNERKFKKEIKQGRLIISYDYVNELIENVIKSLETLLK